MSLDTIRRDLSNDISFSIDRLEGFKMASHGFTARLTMKKRNGKINQ